MKPIIGVVARNDVSISLKEICYINKEVNDAIIKNGGIPLVITPPTLESLVGRTLEDTQKLTDDQNNGLKKMIDLCDGVICPGGDEFFHYDLMTIEYCYKIDKPLLGICLGMQAMGYLFGGQLEDVNNFKHKTNNRYVHEVRIDEQSNLYSILNKSNINVNSRHKSQVINTSLDIVGLSNDNIIEAIEDKKRTFFIGVQWHPESMIEYDIAENKLFSYFIDCCRR